MPDGAESPAGAAEPAEGDGESADAESAEGAAEPHPAVLTPRIRRRRASTQPPPGSDPTPLPEPARHATTENDEQLRRDKPPHWG
ncbi:MAG: hypothetical protein H7226_03705 [Salinibacterium sp.]|nr:hypothetical protein [Salinibacterium sp.]